jgi:SAM-dependent methyltransferase
VIVGGRGGYEEGYRGAPCLWGTEPGSLVKELTDHWPVAGQTVADLGAGEGKNAYFLAGHNADVTAVEVSAVAIENGLRRFGPCSNVQWNQTDVTSFAMTPESFDIVICYGLLHCLPTESTICSEVARYQESTATGGWHILCAFNDRHQDLTAHPGFEPTLLPHDSYAELYAAWDIFTESDADLTETHPHNRIPHTHSMTRILARKPPNA